MWRTGGERERGVWREVCALWDERCEREREVFDGCDAAADGGVFAVAGAVIPEEFHRVTELDCIRRLSPVAKKEKGTGREGW